MSNKKYGDVEDYTDEYLLEQLDIVIRECESRKLKTKYMMTYDILLDYYEELSPESKKEIDLRLKEIGL